MTTIKNVVIAGVTGNLGPSIAKGLVATGKFNVSALKRAESTSPLPEGVTAIDVDYKSPESIVKALKGQDAVISVLPPTSFDTQKALIDASVEAGVKRYLPSEFGGDLDVPFVRKLPVFGYKVQAQEYLKEKAASTDLTYTFVYTGPFLDWCLKVGFLFDLKGKKATVYDGGDGRFTSTTLDTVGEGVAQILLHPEETKNRAVRISGAVTSENELIALAEKASGSKFETTPKDAQQAVDESFAAIQKGDYSPPVMYEFIKAGVLGKITDDEFHQNDNDLLGIKPLSKEELAKLVAQYA